MSTARVNNITRASGSGMPDLGGVSAAKYAPSAWVNFNGVGAVTIRDSYNVASITDNGTGNYVVNFTTALARPDYCVVCTPSNSGSTAPIGFVGASTTAGAEVRTINPQGTLIDSSIVNAVIFGGRA